MIDTKDLMIGNWVERRSKDESKKDFQTVFAISKDGEISFDNINKFMLSRLNPKHIHPIPVTPELLERIGFKRDGYEGIHVRFWEYIAEHYRLMVDNEYSNFLEDRDWHIHIDNVDAESIGSGDFSSLHELQNLVRVITGHDLPITKEMLG